MGSITVELQQILEAREMTQKQLSELSGLRPATISAICRGYVDSISFENITKICDALRVTPSSWIIYDSEWMYDESND